MSKGKVVKKTCSICVEEVSERNIYKCKNNDCSLEACINCIKTYLLSSSNEPHCMGCKNIISLEDFVNIFPKNWRLGAYKEHTKTILWSKEQSNMYITQNNIEKEFLIKKEHEKIRNLLNEVEKCRREINRIQYGEESKSTRKVNNYMYKCPTTNCNGSLNKSYCCAICEKQFCRDCFEEKDETNETDNEHICNEEKKATILQIKKEANPCPNCGEMISKIDGCAQIFCTLCGTAFNWRTGEVEKGVIHNPHAARYFADHPDAKENYIKRIRGEHNNCGVNQYNLTDKMRKLKLTNPQFIYDIQTVCRNIYNFRNGLHEFGVRNIINPTIPDNEDYRRKWITNEISEEHFKKIVFQRYKKYNKKVMDGKIINMTVEVMTDLLGKLTGAKTEKEFMIVWDVEFEQLVDYINEELDAIGNYYSLQTIQIDKKLNIRY